MKPFKLKPQYDETIWAGNQLMQMRGLDHKAGLSWDISFHKNAPIVIAEGEFAGYTMVELAEKHPEIMGNVSVEHSLRMCILDAGDDLSVQIHPDDEYALANENDMGKTESWYVLAAKENAHVVIGSVDDDPEKIHYHLGNNTIIEECHVEPVVPGDFVTVKPGTLHALGRGLLVAEVGTNSDITYRFYDYGRVDAQGNTRQLHLGKSFDVAHFENKPQLKHYPVNTDITENKIHDVEDIEEYGVKLVDIASDYEFNMPKDRFYIITAVLNDMEIKCDGSVLPVKFSESVFVPADYDRFEVCGNGRIMISYSNR